MTNEDLPSPVRVEPAPSNGLTGPEGVHAPSAGANPLSVITPAAPLLVDAEMLIVGLRALQRRIPEYIQLTPREERTMLRAAHLDEKFLDAGVQAVDFWPDAKAVIGWTGAELRHESEEARRWDEVERELRIVLKGVAAANLKRKYRVGKAVLRAYAMLRAIVESQLRNYVELLPYFEEMKRAYANALRKHKSPKGTAAAEAPEE
jgi:hypothetical protein